VLIFASEAIIGFSPTDLERGTALRRMCDRPGAYACTFADIAYAGTYREANTKKSATISQRAADVTSVALDHCISRLIV
jgi:hypothetical protein